MDENTAFTIRTEHDKHYDEKGPSGEEKKTYVMLLDKFRGKLLRDLTPAELKVLLCLALHCDEQMTCWPSLNLIAKETGYSKPTVLKALDDLYERGMVEKTAREKEDGSPDSNLYRIKPPSMLSRGSKKTLPPTQDGSKPELTTGSKADDTEVVKSTLPEVEPNPKVEPIEVENTDAISENLDEKPFDAGTDLYWQHCRTTEANQKAGGVHAVPPSAGGSFALGDRLVAVACARTGRSEPQGRKRENALAFFWKALKAEGLLQGDEEMLAEATRDWLDPEGEYAFFLPQYDLNPKHELALRHFGIVLSKAKKCAAETADRRARDVEAMEASLAALDERRAARPPPPKGDAAWEAVKRELALQMTKATYDTWVAHTVGLGRMDGVYTVACANALARDWLENRLKQTAERTLVGILGESVTVRFEVEA